jgi:hypothetical protein
VWIASLLLSSHELPEAQPPKWVWMTNESKALKDICNLNVDGFSPARNWRLRFRRQAQKGRAIAVHSSAFLCLNKLP